MLVEQAHQLIADEFGWKVIEDGGQLPPAPDQTHWVQSRMTILPYCRHTSRGQTDRDAAEYAGRKFEPRIYPGDSRRMHPMAPPSSAEKFLKNLTPLVPPSKEIT